MFKTCLGALGRKGRLVVIGMMSQYGAGWPQTALKGLPEMLLYKSASLNGFFLIHYAHLFKQHLSQLTNLMLQGQLKVGMDSTVFRSACTHVLSHIFLWLFLVTYNTICSAFQLHNIALQPGNRLLKCSMLPMQGCAVSAGCSGPLAVRQEHWQGVCANSRGPALHS